MLIIVVAISSIVVVARVASTRTLHVDLYVKSIAKLLDPLPSYRISFDVECALEHVHGQRAQSLTDNGHVAWEIAFACRQPAELTA